MKNLLKIALTLLTGIVISVGIFSPGLLMGTPASTAIGNWYQQFLPNINGASVRDIFFTDSLNGFIVTSVGGSNSYILKTTNSGDNWTIKFNHTDPFVRVKFINNNTGFTNAFQTIFKTTNAGENWNPISLPGIFGDDMSVLNDSTIWLAMSASISGGVYFTSTGGANWVQQYSAGSQNPEKIYMYNARIGFISDNSGSPSIRKTTNGGLNWNLNVNGAWFNDMKFADSLTGWYSDVNGIYKTTNTGSNWFAQVIPSGPNIIQNGISKLSIISKDTLWASGNAVFFPNSQIRGMLLRTTNSGDNWLFQIPDTSIHTVLYFTVQFINSNTGWAYHYTTSRGIHTTTGGDPIWITAIEQISSEIPKDFKLYQNYPNPFNPKTNIKYQITKNNSNVQLTVYDIQGRKITELVNQKQNSGSYEVDFSGNGYSSGVYFYRMEVTDERSKQLYTEVKKMILLK